MNCETVRAVLSKGYSATTRAERNAACVHCRTCHDCQAMLIQIFMAVQPEKRPDELFAAQLALAKDRADPEWK